MTARLVSWRTIVGRLTSEPQDAYIARLYPKGCRDVDWVSGVGWTRSEAEQAAIQAHQNRIAGFPSETLDIQEREIES